ncbi:MAG: MotA/TolQ/ExbB proton channel family protein [Deltaproteobacteria bacterium]|nr:MotA/TolQ/ExbB proton channel family protein [Deltaproteobacteria bacterium]
MNFGALLQSAIYLISSTLLYPALVALMVCFIIVIVSLGAFLAEWTHRAKLQKPAAEDWLAILQGKKTIEHFLGKSLDRLDAILKSQEPTWAEVEYLLRQTSLQQQKKLDHLRVLIRLGPSLGLIGTLIPMATGLASLSQGDMTRLSTDLVLAFTTTVVGLAIGVTAFVLYTIRSRWLKQDLETFELIAESRAETAMEKKS